VSPVAEINLEDFLVKAHASYPVENPLLRTFFGCLSRGFQYLHNDVKIRHRDIKPGNVLIHDGRVKISDFGLSMSWAEGRTTTTWSTCPGFSRRYCAPEVANAQARNSSSDIWSLGCVFLEIVTVLKGRTVDDLQKFINAYEKDSSVDSNSDGEVFYYTEPKAIAAWTKQLMAMSTRDNEPIAWVNRMLDHKSENRPHAARMVDYTGHDGKSLEWPFCGLCCSEDSDDENDIAVDTPPTNAFENGLATELDKNKSSSSQKAGLQNAARDGDEKMVRALLRKGEDIEAKDANGWTALYAASYHGHLPIVKMLLEKGADVNAKDNSGRTALYGAAVNGQEDTATLLLENGADIEAKTTDGWTALYGAAFNGKEAVVQLLLDNKADIEAKTDSGRTTLHAAALNGNEGVLRLLVEKGADVNARDDRGMTAVHGAALNGLDTVTLLMQTSSNTSR
jgi:ankyrin repeat protein